MRCFEMQLVSQNTEYDDAYMTFTETNICTTYKIPLINNVLIYDVFVLFCFHRKKCFLQHNSLYGCHFNVECKFSFVLETLRTKCLEKNLVFHSKPNGATPALGTSIGTVSIVSPEAIVNQLVYPIYATKHCKWFKRSCGTNQETVFLIQ